MDCCGLSSTGLQNIDANELTADNATIFSNLNISGYSFLNNVLIKNNTTLLSSLNVSGFTMLNNNTTLLSSLNVSGFTNLDNTTNINGSFYISGLNVLETLNSFGTSISSLNNSTSENENGIVSLGSSLSTLYNFRSDNEDALMSKASTTFSTLIHGVYPGSEILFDTVISKSNYITSITGNECLTKIDSDGKLCVYHPFTVLLPIRTEGYWIVHDELESLQKQAIIDFGKFASLNLAVDKVVVVAGGAAAGVAAIATFLGLQSILSALSGGGGGGGGGGGTPPPPIDVIAINTQLNSNTNNINNLSTSSTLSINTLNNTTNSILGYINNSTRYSILNSNGLDVSGVSLLYGKTTLSSSLNVSDFSSFE